MDKKWYSPLLEKLQETYTSCIIVNDPYDLGSLEQIISELDNYIIHNYKSELQLRAFLNKNKDPVKQIIIFRPGNKDYFSYSVETHADEIDWSLKTIFKNLDMEILRTFPASLYQRIYEKYIAYPSFEAKGPAETLDELCIWLWGYSPSRITPEDTLIEFLNRIYEDLDRIPSPIIKKMALPEEVWKSKEQFYEWASSRENSYSNFDAKETSHKILYAKRKETIQNSLTEIHQLLNSNERDWKSIAYKWGMLSYLKDCDDYSPVISESEYMELDRDIASHFEPFIINNYKSLFRENSIKNLVTIDRVLQFINYSLEQKMILLCFDGMAFQEWFLIKDHLNRHGKWNFKETAIYALLPTITSISRRALFCGEKAVRDHASSDGKGFKDALVKWENVSPEEIYFAANIDMQWKDEYRDFNYLGLVSNIVDDTAHEIVHPDNSKKLMQKIVKDKIESAHIEEFLKTALEEDYRVFITADHGTVWCRGNGLAVDKYLVNSRSKRALQFPNNLLGHNYFHENKRFGLNSFSDTNTLENESIVFPAGRDMFTKKDQTAISHGGIHLEEVIIPFIEVSL